MTIETTARDANAVRAHIQTSYDARVHYNGGTAKVGRFNTLAEAQAAAETERELQQGWIDDHLLPELIAAARQRAADNGDDADEAAADVKVDDAEVEIRCDLYRVGDEDITDDDVAQAIVEAVIDTPFVRWPKSRDGDRAGRPMHLLFADTPTRDHWSPIPLEDSEQMLAWFTAHGLEYPTIARQARRRAREAERMTCRNERNAEAYKAQDAVARAKADVDRLQRELAAAQKVLEVAEQQAKRARFVADEHIKAKDEFLARRIPV